MSLIHFSVGPLQVNCIVFVCDKRCYIVDPGEEAHLIITEIKKLNLPLDTTYTILLTHAHFDHIGATGELARTLQAKVYLHSADHALYNSPLNAMLPWFSACKDLAPVQDFEDNEDFEVIHTPGHSQGSVCFYLPKSHVLLSGDTLFREGIGRTDFPGGSSTQLFDSIQEKLFKLSDNVVVYPGHGETTTIGHERRNNPYLTHSAF